MILGEPDWLSGLRASSDCVRLRLAPEVDVDLPIEVIVEEGIRQISSVRGGDPAQVIGFVTADMIGISSELEGDLRTWMRGGRTRASDSATMSTKRQPRRQPTGSSGRTTAHCPRPSPGGGRTGLRHRLRVTAAPTRPTRTEIEQSGLAGASPPARQESGACGKSSTVPNRYRIRPPIHPEVVSGSIQRSKRVVGVEGIRPWQGGQPLPGAVRQALVPLTWASSDSTTMRTCCSLSSIRSRSASTSGRTGTRSPLALMRAMPAEMHAA